MTLFIGSSSTSTLQLPPSGRHPQFRAAILCMKPEVIRAIMLEDSPHFRAFRIVGGQSACVYMHGPLAEELRMCSWGSDEPTKPVCGRHVASTVVFYTCLELSHPTWLWCRTATSTTRKENRGTKDLCSPLSSLSTDPRRASHGVALNGEHHHLWSNVSRLL